MKDLSGTPMIKLHSPQQRQRLSVLEIYIPRGSCPIPENLNIDDRSDLIGPISGSNNPCTGEILYNKKAFLMNG